MDPPGGTTGLTVFTVVRSIPVSDGAGELTVHRPFATLFTRNSLDEDPSPIFGPDFDEDEYRARIRILSVGLPPAVTQDTFSAQKVLGGSVLPPVAAATA